MPRVTHDACEVCGREFTDEVPVYAQSISGAQCRECYETPEDEPSSDEDES